jgi:hypothetical protein
MLPPQCGQTRLKIDEMTLESASPGSVSKIGLVDLRSLSQVYPRDYCATCSRQLQAEGQFPDRELG